MQDHATPDNTKKATKLETTTTTTQQQQHAYIAHGNEAANCERMPIIKLKSLTLITLIP